MGELPNWVLDLVADLLDEEDVHPKLHADMYVPAAGQHQMVPYDWCPAKPLKRVPDEVKTAARVIQRYRPKPPPDTSWLQTPEVREGDRRRNGVAGHDGDDHG